MSRKKEKAQQDFERELAENKTAFDKMTYATSQLFEARQKVVEAIKNVENFLDEILNVPSEFLAKIENIRNNRKKFETSVQIAQKEVQKFDKLQNSNGIAGATAGVAAAGVIAAVGGPTAAMAIATTFGVASTGVAISSLSGAAATTAALAWLGGGAIAAGGAGMAGGMSVLIVIPVIGVVIAGLAATAGGVFFGIKDKNITTEYEQNTLFLKDATKMWQDNLSLISALCTEILQSEMKMLMILKSFSTTDKNFADWNDRQKQQMQRLMEIADDVSNNLIKLIPIDLEKCDQVEYYKKRLLALSRLEKYPESPNVNIEAKVMDADVYWIDISNVDGWKLELNKVSAHYRILSPEKKRVAYGNKEEINKYFNNILI
jgi:hypothetical protein